VKEAN